MFFRIYRHPRTAFLGALIFCVLSTPVLSNAHETEWPGQKLAAIFPEAKKFVQRRVVLTTEKTAAIEKELGVKLRAEDLKPIFYIPISKNKKPIGVVLFVDAAGPNGVLEGAIGLDMKGKVVKVEIYSHKESDAITRATFLKQFVGMGIDDAFKVGVDVAAADGQEAVSSAVALMPKKALVMSYALFLKKKPTSDAAKAPKPDGPEAEPEMPEVEDLKALMAIMIDDYFIVVDYFEEKANRADAVAAAKRLARYAKSISNFEPPKNADQKDEYVYLQDKFSDTLLKFAEALEKHGSSDETREQWDAIVALINQAHLRFSQEEIDLDTY